MYKFKDQDLTGQSFDGQDLSYSLFRGANLTNCSFVGCNLTGANMRETIIEGTNFTDAEMFYCNQRDAAGTANWTNAKVYGVPTWIPMVGSDNVTTPPLRTVEGVIEEVFTQAGLELAVVTDTSDKDILSRWKLGDTGADSLVGTYGNVAHGRELYEVTFPLDNQGIKDISLVLNSIMSGNIDFDYANNIFIAVP